MNRLIRTSVLIGASAWLWNAIQQSSKRRAARRPNVEMNRWEEEGGALPDTPTVPVAASGPSVTSAHGYPTGGGL